MANTWGRLAEVVRSRLGASARTARIDEAVGGINFRKRLRRLERMQQVTLAMARAAAGSTARRLDETRPETWEFSAFSQNGEDGVIDALSRRLAEPTHTFLEIGASDGLENNTSWLALGRRFSGVMVESDSEAFRGLSALFPDMNKGVEAVALRVTRENAGSLVGRLARPDPDVCSLDIDGVDYYVLEALFERGLRPGVLVVEYNSAFGPERSVTVPYREDFDWALAHESKLYYGVSVLAWRRALEARGYRFAGVETNGVNAFFADAGRFDAAFLEGLAVTVFRENVHQRRKFGCGWEGQYERIRHLPLVELQDR